MGWCIIVVIALNIVLNFSSIMVQDISNACARLKYRWIKRQRIKALRKSQAARRAAYQKSRLERTKKSSNVVEAKFVKKRAVNEVSFNKLELEDYSISSSAVPLNRPLVIRKTTKDQ